MSVLSLERYTVTSQSCRAFEGLLADLLATIRRQPGLLWADGGRTEAEDDYVLLSEWCTRADLDAWMATAEALAWEEATDPLLAADAMRRRFGPESA